MKIPEISVSTTFSLELKKRIQQEISSLSTTNGGYRLFLKSLFYLSLVVAAYVFSFIVPHSTEALCLSAAALGTVVALSGINITHDGVHETFSNHKFLNHCASFLLNVLGASSLFWKTNHTVSHHNFTNVNEKDADLDQGILLRLHPEQKKMKFHRFQYLYFPVLYGLSYIVWSLVFDFQYYFALKKKDLEKVTSSQHLIFWIGKFCAISIFLVTPIYVLGFGLGILFYVIFGVFCGLTLSLVFQLAHITEGVTFHENDDNRKENWFVNQIKTTANFSIKSKFVHFLFGGLNFQIEHHLFPKISHIHYPRLSKVVRDTCKEFEIPYVSYPSVFSAFRSHVLQLKKLGVC
ncbi:MAG: fatty acid desaturase [Cyclobacteriaceae bacterium]